MNELDKKYEIIKIYEFLCETNKVKVDWNNSLFNISETAANCAQALTIAKRIIDYRNEEEKQKKKRMPSKLLIKKIEKELESLVNQWEVNPDMDILYFPGWAESDKGSNLYYVKKWILKMLLEHNKYVKSTTENTLGYSILDNLRDNLEIAINYSLALRGVFYSLCGGEEIDIPVNITFLLFDILGVLVDKTRELRFAIEKSEEIGDRNSRNASTTPIKVNKIKLSDQYTKLKQILSNFDGDQEEKATIDRILKKILKIKDDKSIRKYRQYLLDNFDHEKQDIN
jgi:hypothetical protein